MEIEAIEFHGDNNSEEDTEIQIVIHCTEKPWSISMVWWSLNLEVQENGREKKQKFSFRLAKV